MSKPKFEDTTEIIGESPAQKIPSASGLVPQMKTKKPKFEDTIDISEEPSFLDKAINVVDIPTSLIRTGVEAAISPEREVIPALAEQIGRTIESPTTAASTAPRGKDINNAIAPNRVNGGDTAIGKIADFTTEMALDPLAWFAPSKTVGSFTRKPLLRASEKQAAKAISQYAKSGDVLKEGADIAAIGTRLVAEDLQGLTRHPVKLYEKLSGKRHLQKINPESLETLQLKRGEREMGLIGEASKDITDAISHVETEYGLKPVLPANVMGKQLLEKMKVSISKTSGETPDIAGTERALELALKPFERTKIPDVPIQGVKKTPYDLNLVTETVGKITGGIHKEPIGLSLSEIHELRKNIGRLVSERAFYADPSQAMRTETETLRDVYRELGNVIETQLKGKKIRIGKNEVDAADYYKAQNNRLKSYLDLSSMLEFQPTQALKSPDASATIASMLAQGSIYGATGVGASMMGIPVNPIAAGATGMMFGAGRVASETVKNSTPEYLTSIFKTASKVAPMAPSAAKTGAIQYAREGEFVPTLNQSTPQRFEAPKALPSDSYKMFPNLNPKSTMITPRQMIDYKIPRTTQGILDNKEMVIGKLQQNNVPDELVATIAQALDNDHEAVANIAPLVIQQFPNIFERSKYQVFDGIIAATDRAKAADAIAKREDMNSIQRAKAIDGINKSGKFPQELA